MEVEVELHPEVGGFGINCASFHDQSKYRAF